MRTTLAFMALMLPAAIAFADQNTLSAEFMVGKWSTGGPAGCTSDQDTYVVFHRNHTLEAGKGESVGTVGFWQIDNDRVVLHMLVAPSPGREAHPFFQQNYYYQNMLPRILAVRPDSIDYVHDTEGEAAIKKTVTRCRQPVPGPLP